MTEAVADKPLLQRIVDIRRDEWLRFGLSFAAFFFLLCGYFMLRPIRGAVASSHADLLPWLYSATFASMLLLVPAFGWLVASFRRQIFLPVIYGFVLVCLAGFAWAFGTEPSTTTQLGFYVWLSVVNLMMVSVFWSLMADSFGTGQGERLFSAIAAGGTLGALVGPGIAAAWVTELGSAWLMTLALVLISIAVALILTISRLAPVQQTRVAGDAAGAMGGSIWEGAVRVFQSKYLLLACLLMLTHNLTATFLYNGLAVLVGREIPDFDEATQFFSLVNLVVQAIALVFQFVLTMQLVRRFGMQKTLALVPTLLTGGLLVISGTLTVISFAAVQIAQRALNYGVLGPTKEMLFTVVDRETKYKCKNFIDTVVYRGSDTCAAWAFKGLTTAGLGISQISLVYLPLMAVWFAGVWWLGGLYQRIKAGETPDDPAVTGH